MKRMDVYVARTVLVLMVIMAVMLTIVEFVVLLRPDPDLADALTPRALYAGAALWVAIAAVGWWTKLRAIKNTPLWCNLLFTAIAAGSIAGIFSPAFTRPAEWADTVLSVLFLVTIVVALPRAWRECARLEQ